MIIYFVRSTLSKKAANIIVSLEKKHRRLKCHNLSLKWLEIQARKIKGFELIESKFTGFLCSLPLMS